MPLLTLMVSPVMQLDMSEARNSAAFAMSSGAAMRPSGASSAARATSFAALAGVFTIPGDIQLTRTLPGAPSFASDLVRPKMPAFDAA